MEPIHRVALQLTAHVFITQRHIELQSGQLDSLLFNSTTPEKFGFTNVTIVEEQMVPDGNFSTVVYPNPEETEAMTLGLKKAAAINADILLGTDPDTDRVGVGVKNHKGEWVLMNGNQTAVLAFNYMIEARK